MTVCGLTLLLGFAVFLVTSLLRGGSVFSDVEPVIVATILLLLAVIDNAFREADGFVAKEVEGVHAVLLLSVRLAGKWRHLPAVGQGCFWEPAVAINGRAVWTQSSSSSFFFFVTEL